MARPPSRTQGTTGAAGANNGSQRLAALSATSKNQAQSLLIHNGPVSDEAAWTVPELCNAYEWPNDLACGGTIALIHLRGGWIKAGPRPRVSL